MNTEHFMKANEKRLYQDVDFLTSLVPARNYRNLASLEKVTAYLKEQFLLMGARPEEQVWTAEGREYKNIIASYNPAGKRRLIVGAHYDVCGDGPGADDNASAVAGLLETARILFVAQPSLDCRIDFVAYCLEEPPYFGTQFMGSYIHARSLHQEEAEVIGMICYEMIGYFSDEPGSQPYPSEELKSIYPDRGNFIIVVGIEKYKAFNERVHRIMSQGSGIDVQVISFPGQGGDFASLSDHRNYWKFGYPALMINDTAFLRNRHYHEVTDTIDTLNFPKMAEVVNSACRAIVAIGQEGNEESCRNQDLSTNKSYDHAG